MSISPGYTDDEVRDFVYGLCPGEWCNPRPAVTPV